jgi:murein DD-endopeptidase MepM/ murein hydrolase activator NlpD
MFSLKRLINLSEIDRKVRAFLFSRLSIENILISLALLTSLLLAPSTLLAEEKQPVETSQKNTAAKTTEGLLASTEQMIEQLIQQIDLQKENNYEKGELTENSNPTSFFSSIPNIKPVGGSITSNFGFRVHPVYHLNLFHAGIDFSAPEGTRVQSTGDGIVAFSGYDKGYGQKISINHGYGFKTVYAHLSKSLVRQGQKVKRGDIIALSGNTGVSTGPHMHYEVHKNNVIVNPTAYFFNGTNPDKFITIQKPAPEEKDNNS